MRKHLLLFVFLFSATAFYSQYELSSFTSTGRGGATTFATDYQTIGINPANLGWQYKFEDKTMAFGLNEMTFSAHSEALTRQDVRSMITGDLASFTYDEKIQAARNFTDAGFALNMDYGSIGFAFHGENLGGIGFRINDRVHTFMQFGDVASDIMFLGKTAPYFDQYVLTTGDTVAAQDYDVTDANKDSIQSGFASNPQFISEVIEGTTINAHWVREYNLSYGRKIFDNDADFQLYVGGGIKYIQGLALLEVSEKDGALTAYSSVTPFIPIDYGTAAMQNPSSVTQNPDDLLPKSVGRGFGFDFGANVILFKKLKIGAAITNIGAVTWDGNVYTVQDTLVYDTEDEGLNDYNIFEGVQNITGESGLFKWKGEETKTVALPTVIRAGASIELGEKAEIGVDFIVPGNKVPGSYESVIMGFGGDYRLLPFLRISGGFLTGGNYPTQIPLGITFAPLSGTYEFGVASRDAVSFFKDQGATLSLSIGFLRFRF